MEQYNYKISDNITNNWQDDKNSEIFEKDIRIYETEKFRCTSNYAEALQDEKQHTPRSAVLLCICSILLMLVFSMYCIISRAFDLKDGFYSPETKTTVILGLNSRPAEEELTDGNGKYTPAGVYKAVSPSIVEMLIFSDINYSTPVSSGSGIIMSEDGYIATNAHVITSGKYITVSLNDNKTYRAETIGYDSKTDIAVIKIDPDGAVLTPALFGNSDEVVQGEQVMAIGNPGGLSGSISGGYVSGMNRMIRGDQTGIEMNCIQTDAAISPGNSGGALVNMYGQVIGITSSKYVSSSYEGLGFAITINDAKPIIEELIANGHISGRFKVGITFYTITDEYSKASGLPRGLLIETVDPSCDIANSGIQKDDIIIEVEGKKVVDYSSFMSAIKSGGKGAGDTVRAKIVRITDDETKEQTVIDIKFKLIEDTSGDY